MSSRLVLDAPLARFRDDAPTILTLPPLLYRARPGRISTREVAQRALKDLERDGAIAFERTRIRIVDQTKLEKRAHLSEWTPAGTLDSD
jgi:hypothetical protein